MIEATTAFDATLGRVHITLDPCADTPYLYTVSIYTKHHDWTSAPMSRAEANTVYNNNIRYYRGY